MILIFKCVFGLGLNIASRTPIQNNTTHVFKELGNDAEMILINKIILELQDLNYTTQ